MSAVYHGDAEEEEAWEEVDEEEAKQEAAPGEEAIRHLAPWDPEPATPHTQEDQLIQDQLIHIRERLRRAGLSMAALELWIDRLRSISVIVEQGCRSYGNSGAGELLLDMVGDLVQEICSSRSPPEEQEDGGRRPVEVGMEEEEEETTPISAASGQVIEHACDFRSGSCMS